MSNARPVLPASWQPAHWSEVTYSLASGGGDPAFTQTLS